MGEGEECSLLVLKWGKKTQSGLKQTITYKRQELEMTFQYETITNTQIKSKIPHKHQELQKDQPSASLYLYEQSRTLRHLNPQPAQRRFCCDLVIGDRIQQHLVRLSI